MNKSILTVAFVSLIALSGCLDTDGERAVVGGLAGALLADTVGGSATTGALAGAAAGALCNDAGVCN
jgi:hypothetical protein